jgi:hypothetical protein
MSSSSISCMDRGFGWGFVDTAGTPGKAYGYGAITGTVAGKITGLSVIIPASGF